MSILKLTEEEKVLSSRIEDLVRRCQTRGVAQFTAFFSDREIEIAREVAGSYGCSDKAVFFGGYDDAERKVLGIFPEYYDLSSEDVLKEFPIVALSVNCSGFKTHTHRDFLGSILALGIDRSVVGDILPEENGYSAIVFLHNRMADYVLENLTQIGRDGVKAELCDNAQVRSFKRRFKEISITAASLRVDAVISELLNISREKSVSLIRSQAVMINHRVVSEKSEEIKLCNVISIKGFGKYILEEIGDLNRKGRIRLSIKKYV